MMASNLLRIGWIGFHSEGLSAFRAVLEHGYQVNAFLTLKPELAVKRSGHASYGALCQEFDVPIYEVTNINDQNSVNVLKELRLDLAFVIGWSQIVGPEALQSVRIGMIGAHASLLPHNRGSAPINWVLIRGEEQTGNSLIWLAEGVDSGDIIDQRAFPITPYDTCASLYEKVAQSNKEMILAALPALQAGKRPGRPQVHVGEAILPRRRQKDGLIQWTQGGKAVYDFVRALTRPYPGAFSWLDGERWFIWQCALLPGDEFSDRKPGEIVGSVFSPVEGACGQVVACGRGAIVLLELENESGEVLDGRRLSEQRWEGKLWTDG